MPHIYMLLFFKYNSHHVITISFRQLRFVRTCSAELWRVMKRSCHLYPDLDFAFLTVRPWSNFSSSCVCVLVTHSCPTLCGPRGCSLPGSSDRGILQARILEWVAFPFSGDLTNQGSNPGLLHCRRILYRLSHQGSPRISQVNTISYRRNSMWKQETGYHCAFQKLHEYMRIMNTWNHPGRFGRVRTKPSPTSPILSHHFLFNFCIISLWD